MKKITLRDIKNYINWDRLSWHKSLDLKIFTNMVGLWIFVWLSLMFWHTFILPENQDFLSLPAKEIWSVEWLNMMFCRKFWQRPTELMWPWDKNVNVYHSLSQKVVKYFLFLFFNLNNALSRLIDSRQLSESTLICSSKKTILDAVAMIGGNHLYKFSIVDHYLPRSSSYLQEP